MVEDAALVVGLRGDHAVALLEDPEAQGHAGRAAARLGRARWRAVALEGGRWPRVPRARPPDDPATAWPFSLQIFLWVSLHPANPAVTVPRPRSVLAGRRACGDPPGSSAQHSSGARGRPSGTRTGAGPTGDRPSTGLPLPREPPAGPGGWGQQGSPPAPSPASHSLRIRRQIGEDKHWGGEVLGTTVEGAGGGPSQDGWLGSVTFQWPDMSEQEDTTAPPGRRHSSFWSLVQVPGAGRWESGVWGQQSHSPPVGQCARPALRRLTEGPGAVRGEDGRPWAWGWAPGLSLVQQERGHAAASPPPST